MTTVVSVRGKSPAECARIPGFVYVGRACAGFPASVWGNPYKPSRTMPVEDCVLRYENNLRYSDCDQWASLRSRLPELRGKALGCWCCDWNGIGQPEKPCHAVTLARMAEEMT